MLRLPGNAALPRLRSNHLAEDLRYLADDFRHGCSSLHHRPNAQGALSLYPQVNHPLLTLDTFSSCLRLAIQHLLVNAPSAREHSGLFTLNIYQRRQIHLCVTSRIPQSLFRSISSSHLIPRIQLHLLHESMQLSSDTNVEAREEAND